MNLQHAKKATELANLPDECTEFYCRGISKTHHSIVKVIESDFTKKDPITNRAPLQKTWFEKRSVTTPNHRYVLQYLDFFLNAFKFQYLGWVGEKWTLTNPEVFRTVTAGPFAGQTYWYPYQNLEINRLVGGNYELIRTANPFMNTITKGELRGFPEPTQGANPQMSIKCEQYAITQTGKKKPVTTSVFVTKLELMQVTGWTYDEIVWNCREVGAFDQSTDENVYIIHHDADLTIDGNKFTLTPYFNGQPATEVDYRNLITSYDKKHPGYAVRWKLWNGPKYAANSIYGCTWVKEFRGASLELADTSLNIVEGTEFSYDAATNTLTFDNTTTEVPMLWGEYEENPAQGKNDMGICYYNLRTGKKTTTAVGNVPETVQ